MKSDDEQGGTVTNTFTISVNDVNEAPVIANGDSVTVTMSEDGSPIGLTLNASDVENDTLTWTISSAAAHGTASVSGTGLSKDISYIPEANYNGSDSFVVTVMDGKGGEDSITINVTVTPVNDAPTTITLSNNSVGENKPAGTTVGTFNTTDIDSNSFTYSLVGEGNDNASFTIEGNTLKTAASFDAEK